MTNRIRYIKTDQDFLHGTNRASVSSVELVHATTRALDETILQVTYSLSSNGEIWKSLSEQSLHSLVSETSVGVVSTR